MQFKLKILFFVYSSPYIHPSIMHRGAGGDWERGWHIIRFSPLTQQKNSRIAQIYF